MKRLTSKDIKKMLNKSDNKLHLSDVIVPVCSTCKGHKLLLNEIGFPIMCHSCNGNKQEVVLANNRMLDLFYFE